MASGEATLRFDNVSKSFVTPAGQLYTAVRGLSFSVGRAEFVSVVGPSGCGKSTVLNMASGLYQPSSGTVYLDGAPVTDISLKSAYMFQTDALLPWKTVLDNVAIGPIFRGAPKREARQQAQQWLRRVGLEGFGDRYPHQLSGGMRKRVSMAQDLVVDPEVLLMDEPFSALDVQTRQLMENEVLGLWSEYRKTVVFVTHDLEEAIALSDRVVLFTAGPEARVKSEFAIDLPRPRNVQEIKFNRRFSELYERIWQDLRDEVMASYLQATGGSSPTAVGEAR
jgi:NitT/TauT family transport system ATP-binding protein